MEKYLAVLLEGRLTDLAYNIFMSLAYLHPHYKLAKIKPYVATNIFYWVRKYMKWIDPQYQTGS